MMPEIVVRILAFTLITAPLVFIVTKYIEYHHIEKLDSFLALFGEKKRRSRLISGHYYSVYWRYNRNSEMRIHRGVAKLTRFGFKKQRARFILISSDKTTLEGRIDELSLLSGTWKSDSDDAAYHGVFQFRHAFNQPVVFGKWLGFNGSYRINCGIWALLRMPSKLSDVDQKLFVEELGEFEKGNSDLSDTIRSFEETIRSVINPERDRDLSMSVADVQFDSERLAKLGSDRPIGSAVGAGEENTNAGSFEKSEKSS